MDDVVDSFAAREVRFGSRPAASSAAASSSRSLIKGKYGWGSIWKV